MYRKIFLALLVSAMLISNNFSTVFAKNMEYYTETRIAGYDKGDFATLSGDDINFRTGPTTFSQIEKCLPRHSLFRVLREDENGWSKVVWGTRTGYVAKEYLTKAEAEPLIDEDFILGDWQLGDKFLVKEAKNLGKLLKTDNQDGKRVYVFEQMQIAVKRSNHKILEMNTVSPVAYTMRGVGVGDSAARVVGQYGMPFRIVYTGAKNGAVVIYGYNFADSLKSKSGLDFYIDADGKILKIILAED